MNIIFQIWSELIYRKCYFYKLSAFKMKPKNMFAAFTAVSHTLLPRFVFGFGFFFFHMYNCQTLLNKLRMEMPTALSLRLVVSGTQFLGFDPCVTCVILENSLARDIHNSGSGKLYEVIQKKTPYHRRKKPGIIDLTHSLPSKYEKICKFRSIRTWNSFSTYVITIEIY